MLNANPQVFLLILEVQTPDPYCLGKNIDHFLGSKFLSLSFLTFLYCFFIDKNGSNSSYLVKL